MKLAAAVGTRPELVKMAPIIRAAAHAGIDLVVIHTGQHYAADMSDVFFEQLELPQPHHNLAVGSGTHAYQIGTMLLRLEQILAAENPDIVLVEGDTNTVLAAAVTANKMGLRVGHVEAGLRSHDRTMPEEVNRILVDHLADELYAPTAAAARNLELEGIPAGRITITGNTVVDEVLHNLTRALQVPSSVAGTADGRAYALATVHRAENTDDPDRLRGIIDGLQLVGMRLGLEVLLSLHPRTADRLRLNRIPIRAPIRSLAPVGYFESIALQARATIVLTDSGGLQEEACTLGVPCVTLRDNTERPETIEVGANQLAGTKPEDILAAARVMVGRRGEWVNPFGDGRAGARIISHITEGKLVPVAMDLAPNVATIAS